MGLDLFAAQQSRELPTSSPIPKNVHMHVDLCTPTSLGLTFDAPTGSAMGVLERAADSDAAWAPLPAV